MNIKEEPLQLSYIANQLSNMYTYYSNYTPEMTKVGIDLGNILLNTISLLESKIDIRHDVVVTCCDLLGVNKLLQLMDTDDTPKVIKDYIPQYLKELNKHRLGNKKHED